VVDASLFTTGATGLLLVVVQSTVSDSHDVESKYIKRIHARVCVLFGIKKVKDLPVLLAFITDPNGIRAEQTIIISTTGVQAEVGAFNFDLRQGAMLLGDDCTKIIEWERKKPM
jgi:hypothetical protein